MWYFLDDELRLCVISVSQTEEDSEYPAINAFDDDDMTFNYQVKNNVMDIWWKAVFKRRVFVNSVKIINRKHSGYYFRSDNMNILTKLYYENSAYPQVTICANTGDLNAEKTLPCQQQADELEIFMPTGTSSDGVMNIAEVKIFGYVVLDFWEVLSIIILTWKLNTIEEARQNGSHRYHETYDVDFYLTQLTN